MNCWHWCNYDIMLSLRNAWNASGFHLTSPKSWNLNAVDYKVWGKLGHHTKKNLPEKNLRCRRAVWMPHWIVVNGNVSISRYWLSAQTHSGTHDSEHVIQRKAVILNANLTPCVGFYMLHFTVCCNKIHCDFFIIACFQFLSNCI